MRRLIISLSVLVPGTANLLSQSIGYDSNATDIFGDLILRVFIKTKPQ